MSFNTAMELAASGLRAARMRMNLTASNLANANTTRAADGGPYKRRDIVVTATPLNEAFSDVLSERMNQALRSVEVTGVRDDPRPPRSVYDPGHPDADAKGIVKMPNVSPVEEMVNMITAARAYEAGVTTMQTIKSMATKALSIGR